MLDELFRTLGALCEPPSEALRPLAEALDLGEVPGGDVYTDLFLFQLYPYASVYLGPEGMLGGEGRDRVAGFWRVLGATPPAEPDHLAVLLALYGEIASREDAGEKRWRDVRCVLLHEHLLSWLPIFLDRLVEIAPPFYRRWGELLEEALQAETQELDLPNALPAALREAPGIDDPREHGGEAFLRSMLAPVRTGFVLVRDDLLRAGRELGLAARMGERKWVLEALFAQDASAVLRWLANEAQVRSAKTRGVEEISVFWRERAETCAKLCLDLAEEAA